MLAPSQKKRADCTPPGRDTQSPSFAVSGMETSTGAKRVGCAEGEPRPEPDGAEKGTEEEGVGDQYVGDAGDGDGMEGVGAQYVGEERGGVDMEFVGDQYVGEEGGGVDMEGVGTEEDDGADGDACSSRRLEVLVD